MNRKKPQAMIERPAAIPPEFFRERAMDDQIVIYRRAKDDMHLFYCTACERHRRYGAGPALAFINDGFHSCPTGDVPDYWGLAG